jgi:tight adherence protein B
MPAAVRGAVRARSPGDPNEHGTEQALNALTLVFIGLGSAGLLVLLFAVPSRESASLKDRVELADTQGTGSLDAYKVTYTAWQDEDPGAEADEQPLSDKSGFRERVREIEARYPRLRGYTKQLADADISLYAAEWFVLVGLGGLVLSFILYAKTGSLIGFVVGIAVAYMGSGMAVGIRQSRRKLAFDRQLGDTLLLLSNALKAGYGFDQAMQAVAKDARHPVKEEFLRYCREVGLGLSTDAALLHMLDRNKSMDLNIAVSAVQINRAVGGNLTEVLESIAETIRERVKVKQEIKTLTAQARFSGYLISVLPVALAVLLYVISPTYFGPMLNNGIGLAMLGIAGFFIMVGFFIIRKIVAIDV